MKSAPSKKTKKQKKNPTILTSNNTSHRGHNTNQFGHNWYGLVILTNAPARPQPNLITCCNLETTPISSTTE